MHYHLEIIMPPTDNVEEAVERIMKPFSENCEDEYQQKYAFWDFYVIGGRWAGDKLRQSFDADKLNAFHSELEKRKITVSGLQCGKQKLEPDDQIPMVDALWREYFPEGGETCPLFSHYNDQYQHSDGYPDIMPLKDIPEELSAERVIIASYNYKDELEAEFMISGDFWNGVTHVKAEWEGTVQSALKKHLEKIQRYTDEAREKYTPRQDWIVVTVDYHN